MQVPRNRFLRGLLIAIVYLMGVLGIVASGGGSGGGVRVDSILLDQPLSPTYETGVTVTGSLVVITPVLKDAGDKYSDSVKVKWENQLTGGSGSEIHNFSGECKTHPLILFFPICSTSHDGALSITVALGVGNNKITSEAEGKEASVEVVRLQPTPLDAPTGVSVQAADGEAIVSWNPVTNATFYNIYYATNPGVTKSNYSMLPDGNKISGVASPHTISSLTNGIDYYFVVTAAHASPAYSESAESLEEMAIVEGAPAAPLSVSIDSITNDSAEISWDMVRGAASYNIYYSSKPGVTKSNYSTLPEGNKFTGGISPQALVGLTIGLDYYFVVTSVNPYGESIESFEVMARIGPNLSFDIKTFRFTWSDLPAATHYRLLENPDGISGFSQVGNDIPQGAEIYDHIVALYKRTNASYIFQSCVNQDCTDFGLFNIVDNLVDAIGYFPVALFAISLSGDGNTFAVGQKIWLNSVRVYGRGTGNWGQRDNFLSSNIDPDDEFGYSVSLSLDGNTLAVGAISVSGTGTVYVFTRTAGDWSQQSYVKASNAGAGDRFGESVSLSADGNTLAVGAVWEDGGNSDIDPPNSNGASNSGAVYVFTRTSGNWGQQALIKAHNVDAGDLFGTSVSLSNDGNTLAVGANGEDGSRGSYPNHATDNLASGAGAAYVFTRTGGNWSMQDYIKASNSQIGVGDEFGISVSLSGDGSTLVVGATGEDSSTSGINTFPNNFANGAGAAYLYSRTGDNWGQQAYVKASNTDASDGFGVSVSLSNDGNTLAVGANEEDSSTHGMNTIPNNGAGGAGAVYMYTRGAGEWSQQAYVKASNTYGWGFGRSINLSADGDTLAVGASGAAYLY